eukprot:jgi/Ulvmu1/7133/UM034_0039.1
MSQFDAAVTLALNPDSRRPSDAVVHFIMDHSSLVSAAASVLLESDAFNKKALTDAIVRAWHDGALAPCLPDGADLAAPDQPLRDDRVKIVSPRDVPKLGKGGTLASRQAIVHSLVHIESCAVDLSWDIIARFGSDPAYREHLPKEFFDDFVEVAEDECRHFTQLAQRLQEMGSSYGAFPAHEGLWQSARETAGSLPARLAVEHCVHEARGLDVLPATIQKFRNAGDVSTATLLETVVLPEEVRHCAAGVRWLRHLHGVAHGHTPPPQTNEAGGPAPAIPRGAAGARPGSSEDAVEGGAAAAHGQEAERADTAWASCGSSDRPCSTDKRSSAGTGAEGIEHADKTAVDDGDLGGQQAAVATRCPGDENCTEGKKGPEGTQPSPDSHIKQTCSAIDDHGDVIQCGRKSGTEPAWMVEARQYETVEQWFHALVRAHFKGNTKPPFNERAREQAGFTEAWYKPLMT